MLAVDDLAVSIAAIITGLLIVFVPCALLYTIIRLAVRK